MSFVMALSGAKSKDRVLGEDVQTELAEGLDAVLRMQGELDELANTCGQAGALSDLAYFLSRPTVQKKRPVMVAFRGAASRKLEAAVFFFEYRLAGCRAGVFATDDTTGRRNLVASPGWRPAVALRAARELIERGAHTVLVSFQHEDEAVDPELSWILGGIPAGGRWASREREVLGYLPLKATFDETLAGMGKKTRAHLRYYRKRAETDLGASFIADASVGREEFLVLNRSSAYAVSDEVAGWRYDALKRFERPVLMGVKDREGRWICLAGGRRFARSLELHWLMNREDLPDYSLSTVIRCYVIENEIALGNERFYIHGGTTHSIRNAFVTEKSTDVLVVRPGLMTPMRFFAEKMLPEDNMLRNALLDDGMVWRPVR
jgi:hypothetical protein